MQGLVETAEAVSAAFGLDWEAVPAAAERHKAAAYLLPNIRRLTQLNLTTNLHGCPHQLGQKPRGTRSMALEMPEQEITSLPYAEISRHLLSAKRAAPFDPRFIDLNR